MGRIQPKLVSGPARRGPSKGATYNMKHLSRIRARRDMTQAYVAERLGVSSNFVAEVESGSKLPSDTFIEKLAQVYDMKLKAVRNLCYLAFKEGRLNRKNEARNV